MGVSLELSYHWRNLRVPLFWLSTTSTAEIPIDILEIPRGIPIWHYLVQFLSGTWIDQFSC